MIRIADLQPTVFLRQAARGLEQRLLLGLRNEGPAAAAGVRVRVGPWAREAALGEIPPGDSWHDLFVPEERNGRQVWVQVLEAGGAGEPWAGTLPQPRHWRVHVVQLSHHDLGYTSLPSRVLEEQIRWLDEAVTMAADTSRYPEEARFRLVIEQAWSVEHAMLRLPARRAARLARLLQQGRFELTALYGNLITELCGHETLVRALYPAFRLRREYGIPIVSAEHNDIPGFAWGLSEVLCGAGVRLFCPGLPLYYQWGAASFPSFWDEEAVFGRSGLPGAFWWESPSGQRILFWCNNQGCGGDCRGTLPGLARRLAELQQKAYPCDVLRWPVSGGARDNSPYIADYAETIREWNRTWAWPQLVCSTNARFLADFSASMDLTALPVRRGDVPGQDYPVGAISTAAATAANRRNHAELPAAEALAAAASLHARHPYPAGTSATAWRDVLLHDEHTWGHHLPAGPASAASDLEKAAHAWRAAAWAHDAARKAVARLADAVRLDSDGLYLMVFNPLPYERVGRVHAPLRELDNAGSDMVPVPPDQDPARAGYLRGVILNTRWPVHPPPEIVQGRFALVDAAAGAAVPYQILECASPFDPEPFAPQRLGLSGGGRRYGFFEEPLGLRATLCFEAGPVPPLGYRTYRLQPLPSQPAFLSNLTVTRTSLENRHWRLELDPGTGAVRSLTGTADGRQWVDRGAPHAFGVPIVQGPDGGPFPVRCEGTAVAWSGPLGAALRSVFSAHGHPRVEVTVALWAGDPRIEVFVAVLKDPTPLLQTSVAFPFAIPDGRFTCEMPLCVYDPAADRLPGAFVNRLAVQDWVLLRGSSGSVLWGSLDAPIVSLGRLWPPRVSQAHSCVPPPHLDGPPQPRTEPCGGTIYSCLTYNNFGTNFAVSQSGPLLFRYCIQPLNRAPDPEECIRFGAESSTPLQTVFTRREGDRPPGVLPLAASFARVSPPAVRMLTLKAAEDGHGVIVRLWNPTGADVQARVELPGRTLRAVECVTLAEEPSRGHARLADGAAVVRLAPAAVSTLRLTVT